MNSLNIQFYCEKCANRPVVAWCRQCAYLCDECFFGPKESAHRATAERWCCDCAAEMRRSLKHQRRQCEPAKDLLSQVRAFWRASPMPQHSTAEERLSIRERRPRVHGRVDGGGSAPEEAELRGLRTRRGARAALRSFRRGEASEQASCRSDRDPASLGCQRSL